MKIGVKNNEKTKEIKKLFNNSLPTKSRKNRFEKVVFLIMLSSEKVRTRFPKVDRLKTIFSK